LLRFFDQVRFHPVSADDLLRMRAAFPHGGVEVKIEEQPFSYRRYRQFLAAEAESIAAFKQNQQEAFDAERERWAAAGQDIAASAAPVVDPETPTEPAIPPGCFAVTSPVAGSLWRVLRAVGERVGEGEPAIVVEAMKTEITVAAPSVGVVREVRATPGQPVRPGQVLMVCEGIRARA
jgi:urea carboxylase